MYILDVRQGAAGDMILSALIDAGLAPLDEIQEILDISARAMDPKAVVNIKKETVSGESGTSLSVLHWNFDHVSATSMQKHMHIATKDERLLKSRQTASSIFETILRAESEVHKTTVGELHLHETGSPDTLVDIIGSSYLYEKLCAEVARTSIGVGRGMIKIAHGTFRVPPPATAIILRDMQWRSGPYDGEMATPTGTAILKTIAKIQVRDIPPDSEKLGTGFGSKTFAGIRTAVRLYRTKD